MALPVSEPQALFPMPSMTQAAVEWEVRFSARRCVFEANRPQAKGLKTKTALQT
jgi:hypothetical protein